MTYRNSSIQELANVIRNGLDAGVPIAVVMGAGISVSAGIPTANEIIAQIKDKWSHVEGIVRNKSYSEYMKCLPKGDREQLLKTLIENSKINISHFYLSELVKKNIVDRILTTNFDSLSIQSLALSNIFPGIYDLTASEQFISDMVSDKSVFFLHGRSNGFAMLNTKEELDNHKEKIKEVLMDTNFKRRWIIIGYSGNCDPVYECLSEIKEFKYGLYWLGRKDEPESHIADRILSTDGAAYIKINDSDSFFIDLSRELGIPDPSIINKPFSHLKNIIDNISSVKKNEKLLKLTDEAEKNIDQAITMFECRIPDSNEDYIQRTREILVFKKYEDIEEVYGDVLISGGGEAKENLADAIHNYALELREQAEYCGSKELKILANDFVNKGLKLRSEYVLDSNNYISPRKKVYVNDTDIDIELNNSGISESAKLFNVDASCVKLIPFKIYNKDNISTYLHRVYVRNIDFSLVSEEFELCNTINIVDSISKKKDYCLHYKKSHQFIPTVVGGDQSVLRHNSSTPCMLHIQVTYAENIDKSLFPVELLITKYLGPISLCGFVVDKKSHSDDIYSKTSEDILKNKDYRDIVVGSIGDFYKRYYDIEKVAMSHHGK